MEESALPATNQLELSNNQMVMLKTQLHNNEGTLLPVEGVSVTFIIDRDEIHHENIFRHGIHSEKFHLKSGKHPPVKNTNNLRSVCDMEGRLKNIKLANVYRIYVVYKNDYLYRIMDSILHFTFKYK